MNPPAPGGRSGADAVHAVLEAAPAAVIGVDPTGRVDYLNPRGESVFGLRAEEVVGSPVERLVPQDLPGLRAVPSVEFGDLPVVRAGGTSPTITGRRHDGTDFVAEARLIPLDTEEGPWLVVTLNDVTARRRAAERLEELGRAYLMLAEINQAIVRAPDEVQLFSETCRVAVEQGGYAGAWVLTTDTELNVKRVASAGALEEYIDEVSPPLEADLTPSESDLVRHLLHGRAYFSDDFLADRNTAPWHELAARHGVRGSATLPLRRADRTVAILTLYSDRPHVFDAEVQALLVTIGENVSFALERLDAVARLRASAAQRRDLSRRLVSAQEEERARVAADVHDESVQALAAVDLRLGLLRRRLLGTAEDLVPDVEAVQEAVAAVTSGLRDLLFELESADTATPLPELVRDAAEQVLESSGIRWSLAVDTQQWDHTSVLSQTDRGQALRTVKEVLHVLRQRARTGAVELGVAPGADGVEISVAHLGDGLDPTTPTIAPDAREVATMADRAELSGGWLRLETVDGRSAVRFWLPFDPSAPPYDGPRY